jgi:hypothetical protein
MGQWLALDARRRRDAKDARKTSVFDVYGKALVKWVDALHIC